MLRIGLTGGIASGKSSASARFDELGAKVVDHDLLARRAVEPGSAALAEIVHDFGDRIVIGGELDRAALAQVVFHDSRARAKLDAIIHPYVYAMGMAADRQARAESVAVVVHDIPLLAETGQGNDFGLIVTIAAPVELRLARMMATRGMSRDDALARIESQATDEERAAIADVVLDGSGSVESLRQQVDQFWATHVPAVPR